MLHQPWRRCRQNRRRSGSGRSSDYGGATVEPDTDAVTLTEEIPVSADESVIEEVKIPEQTTVTEEIPVSADESVIEEVPAQEASSSMADMSNPNKIMTPDEIAAIDRKFIEMHHK